MMDFSKMPVTPGLKRVGGIIGYIILGLAAYFIIGTIVMQIQVERNTVYTICYTTKTLNLNGPDVVYYYYYYKGIKYEGDDRFHGAILVPGGKYFVKFSSKDPDYGVFTSIPVPDCIKEQPFEGWLEVPVCGNKDTSSFTAH